MQKSISDPIKLSSRTGTISKQMGAVVASGWVQERRQGNLSGVIAHVLNLDWGSHKDIWVC